jgi:hypothetical protein
VFEETMLWSVQTTTGTAPPLNCRLFSYNCLHAEPLKQLFCFQPEWTDNQNPIHASKNLAIPLLTLTATNFPNRTLKGLNVFTLDTGTSSVSLSHFIPATWVWTTKKVNLQDPPTGFLRGSLGYYPRYNCIIHYGGIAAMGHTTVWGASKYDPGEFLTVISYVTSASNTWSRCVLMGGTPSPSYCDSILSPHPTTGTIWLTGATKFNMATVGKPPGVYDALWPQGKFVVSTIQANGGMELLLLSPTNS